MAKEEKKKINLKDLLSKKQVIFVFLFFIVLVAVFFYIFFTPNYYEGTSPKRFEINRGEGLSTITENLYEQGVIPSKLNFKVAAFLYGAEKKIRAARYNIPNGLSYLDLLDLLMHGDADFLVKVTIKDGSTPGWVASKLKRDAFVDSVDFINMINDKKLIDSFGIKASSLEGYLLPQEYFLFERSSAKEALGIILKGFNEFINDSLKQRAKEMGYSIHQVLTLASIVEGETNKVEEMPDIAGVYYNRLKIGMRLQADPTVQYLQKDGWKRLLYKDLKINSPYNTYMYAGLPPGPINNPGKDALLAAFYPEDNDYFFFVADGKGGHKFAENYSIHLRNVKEYREWLNSQKK